MSSEAAIAEQQRQLSALAELSLAMAGKLHDASMASDDTKELVRLADAFSKVSKCLRMCIALSMRLTRGEAPARRPRELDLDADYEDENDWDEDFDGDERLESEQLFDRLPSGPVPLQIASIARTLRDAAKAFPGLIADGHRARCDAIIAEAAVQARPSPELVEQTIRSAIERIATRPRGPPSG